MRHRVGLPVPYRKILPQAEPRWLGARPHGSDGSADWVLYDSTALLLYVKAGF